MLDTSDDPRTKSARHQAKVTGVGMACRWKPWEECNRLCTVSACSESWATRRPSKSTDDANGDR
jgi:hypothetical protein